MPRTEAATHGKRIEVLVSYMILSSWLIGTAAMAFSDGIVTVDAVTPTSANPRNDHQLIFPLADGRLMLVWSEYYVVKPTKQSRKALLDNMPCRIAAKVSSDHGRTWGAGFVLQPNTGVYNVKHPNLLRLPTGEVVFFFTQWNSQTERIVLMRRSKDDCRSWSEPNRVSTLPGINNINNDHVLQLRSGRIVLPAFNSPSVWDKADHWHAFCYYSDDDGRSWNASSRKIDLPKRGAEEPCIVEHGNGTLLAFLRTSLGRVYRSESKDGGRNWSDATATTLTAPASPPLVKRIPSTGDLLAVWNNNFEPTHHHQGERMPLSSAISRDEGVTWGKIKDIERIPGGSAAYAAVYFREREALVTYYFQQVGFGGASGVRLKAIPITWFYE